MRHVLRVNVRGSGYSLLTFTSQDDVVELPLDVVTDPLPEHYLGLQAALDDLLDHNPGRVHLAASAAESGEAPLVLGGYCVGRPDEHSRVGIGFLHGVLGDASTSVRDLTAYMVKMLSAPLHHSVHKLVGAIAVGQQEVGVLVAEVLSAAENLDSAPLHSRGTAGFQVRTIVHDCGGAALAWMAMAQAHAGLREPWQFRDVVHDSGVLATTSSALHGAEIMLSDYLGVAVQAVDNGLAVGKAISALVHRGESADRPDEDEPADDEEPDASPDETDGPPEVDWERLYAALWPVTAMAELMTIEAVGTMSGLVLRGRFKVRLKRSDVVDFKQEHAAIVLRVVNRKYWPDQESMTFVILFAMSPPNLVSDLFRWLA